MRRILFRGSRAFEFRCWLDDNTGSIGVNGIFTAVEETEDSGGSFGGIAEAPAADPVSTHFLEIELLDEEDQPIPNEQYRVTFPDGTVREGRLDANGLGRFPNLPSDGDCQVSFHVLDQAVWEPA